jgi:hypothetical protein
LISLEIAGFIMPLFVAILPHEFWLWVYISMIGVSKKSFACKYVGPLILPHFVAARKCLRTKSLLVILFTFAVSPNPLKSFK